MRRINKTALALGLVVLGAVSFVGASRVKADSKSTIEEGVFIGNVNVGGMTEDEAKAAIDSYVDSLMNTTFTLQGVAGSMEASARDMGVTADVDSTVEEAMKFGHTGNLITRYKEINDLKKENAVLNMNLSIDKEATAKLIYAESETLNIEAVDCGLKRSEGSFVIVPGSQGQEVNIEDSVYAINDFLAQGWDGSTNTIDLVVEVVDPRGTEEELSKVKDVLGTFTTNYASSPWGRKINVENGTSKINGTVLYPGEEFSVYGAVSPFSAENGYELAGSYANGTTVETYGGGICQVSTTLYNAVIRAELDISRRYNHSMIVGYVDPSADAAISGLEKDMRFVNNTDAPIYIEGGCGGGYITFTVYGQESRPANRSVSFVSETLSTNDPQTEFKYDAGLPLGSFNQEQSAHRGVVAKLWKVVKVDGEVESRTEFNNSTYKASPKIIVVGVGGASAKQIAAIKAAGASGDEGAVKAAVAAAKEKNEKKKKKKKDEDDKKDEEDDSDDSDDSDDGTDEDDDSDSDETSESSGVVGAVLNQKIFTEYFSF